MKLEKKKALVAKTLNIGKERVIFNKERLSEIKEAITKQDIRELFANGAISIREIKGRKKVYKRRQRRREGSIRKKHNMSKRKYIILTRKLRNYLAELRKKGKLSRENYILLRTQLRAGILKSKEHIKEHLTSLP